MTDHPVDRIVTADGRPLIVRAIGGGDAAELIAMHGRLSERSVHRRYFGMRPVLSARDAERFTHLDEVGRVALVATADTGALVAVARYEGGPGQDSAELAMIVADEWQGQGLGRAMLGRLIDVARVQGLPRLVAEVLDVNTAMLGLLRRMDVPTTATRDVDVTTVTLTLTGLELSPQRRARAERHAADTLAQRTRRPDRPVPAEEGMTRR